VTNINPAAAHAHIQPRLSFQPRVGLILGSGWGEIARKVDHAIRLPFSEIPGFHAARAPGHEGQLIVGFLEQIPVLVMSGRFHRYEGFTIQETTFPIHVMKQFGISEIIITNAAGAINPKLTTGDVVVVNDHINWLGQVPRYSTHTGEESQMTEMIGRTPDIYSAQFSNRILRTARANDISAQVGTYLATLGPTYETRSEYRMMRILGADVVGMSSIPEAMIAKNLGIEPVVLSLVTNVAKPDHKVIISHEEVLEIGRQTASNAEILIRGFLHSLAVESKNECH